MNGQSAPKEDDVVDVVDVNEVEVNMGEAEDATEPVMTNEEALGLLSEKD